MFWHEVDLGTTPPSAPHSSQPRSGHVAGESWLNSCSDNVEAQKHSPPAITSLQSRLVGCNESSSLPFVAAGDKTQELDVLLEGELSNCVVGVEPRYVRNRRMATILVINVSSG